MKKIVWTLCLVLFSIMASYADKTIYVSPAGTGDGTSAGTPCKLNDIFGKVPTVSLDATGTTTLSFDATTPYSITTSNSFNAGTGCVLVPDNATKIIFEGHNAILNAGSTAVRMFRIGTGTDVEFRNLTFNNGTHPGSPGGAIFFLGTNLKISGCTFYNCSANSGGALSSRGVNVTISNSYFNSDKFTNPAPPNPNTTARGAAITVSGTATGGALLIENTTFNNNNNGLVLSSGNCNGTAICTANDGITGGTGYLNTITINNCTFYKNLAYTNTNNAYTAIYMDELSGTSPSTSATFTNNTFYGNSNGALFIVGAKQTVKMVNNVIVGNSYAVASGGSVMDFGVLANTTLSTRPAIIGNNNYIVAKTPRSSLITESSFQSGTNGNTFVTTTAQSVIDALYLNPSLSTTTVPYQTITNGSSPLVNAGTNSVSGVTIPSADMRGIARGNGGTTGAGYDIGSFELSKLAISANASISASGLTDNELAGTEITVNAGEYTVDATKTVNVINVQPGAKLTLNNGSALNASVIKIQSTSSGTGTFVDKNTVGTTVAGTVQQYLTSGRNWYIATPVSNATTASLSSTSSIVYYNEPTAQWLSPTGGSQLTAGKGYISTATTATGAISFTGTLNTGTVNIPLTRTTGITKEGFNLVGNPYASYLDWALVDTTSAKVLSSIWYRTQTAANAYAFDTYNGSGNVSTNLGATKVTNLIPPMQAFWVRVKQGESGGTLTFTNAMRAHGDYSTNIFKAPSAKTTTQQLVRLEVSTDVNRDEALIYFNENASNGYDAFDSPKMSNGSASIPEIYTTAGNEKLVINGMKNLTDDIELPLGFTTGQANSFSIKASEVTNLNDVDIILKDKLLNKEFNLLSGDTYSFTSDVVSTDSRFAVLFKTRSVNTAFEPVSNGAKVYARANKGRITFINENEPGIIIPVVIYNNAGQQVSNFNLNQSKTILADRFARGVYVVSFKSKEGIGTKKIIVD
jgi:hypothetical protein